MKCQFDNWLPIALKLFFLFLSYDDYDNAKQTDVVITMRAKESVLSDQTCVAQVQHCQGVSLGLF